VILDKFYASSFHKIHPDSKFYSEWCINNDLKVIFITINKCAGSALRNYLPSKNFIVIDNNKIDDDFIINKIINEYNFYSVIRNPNDRYVSGLNEFIDQINGTKKEYIEDALKNNKFVFDEHLLPQYSSLEKILNFNKKINLIKLDENLSRKISNIFNFDDYMPIVNSYKDKKKSSLNFCNKMFENYCEKNINYHKLYEKDFNLYNLSK